MKTRSMSGGLAVCMGLALAAGCATTEMTSTWVDPAAKGNPLQRIAVVCLTKDEGIRRMAEDEASQQIKGAQVIPSYRVLGSADLKDREAVKTSLKSQGFDGVLVMRMAGVSEQVTAVGGPYGTFDGYYDWAGGMVYSPGYLETDTVVRVVSNLYSLNENKLVWSGASQTFDPASTKQFVGDVSKAVAKQLQKDRLVL